jgi:CRP-like cAMP-binding protein
MTAVQRASFSEKLGLLRELELFSGLSDADIEAIGHATTMIHCRPGQMILSPDDAPDQIHIVKAGRVRLYRVSLDGKQLTLDIYDKGTILGDMRLLGQDRVPEAYAETLDAAVICTITPDELRRLIERYPIIGVNIISFLSRRLQQAQSELE